MSGAYPAKMHSIGGTNMASIKNGCTKYITTELTIEVGFPEDQVVCDLCDFCRSENAGTRFRCILTAEILAFHNKGIGRRCPLDLPKTNESEEN